MKILGLIIFLLSMSVEAAAPVVSCVPTRTSGTAPVGVVIDCTGTTDADTSNPFRDLLYWHNFGDSSPGNWTYGAKTAQSKNFGTGPVAGHVYETAGTFTATSCVSDGTLTACVSNTITVAAADTTFASTATVCFYNSTVGSGCPTGATETQSSDFDAALSSCMGTTKRCLFKRGDTFTASTTGTVASAGPNTIGAYGSGALPIISGSTIQGIINITNVAVNDLRIMDLDIRGGGSGDTSSRGIRMAADVSNVTILRVSISDTGHGISMVDTTIATGMVIQESRIYNYYATSGGNAFYGRMYSGAWLGNYVGPSYGEHLIRIQRGKKVAITNNTTTDPMSGKAAITIRADVHVTAEQDSQYIYVAGNKLLGGDRSSQMLLVEPVAGSEDDRIFDYVLEHNWLQCGTTCTYPIQATGSRGVIRNNLIDMSSSVAVDRIGIFVTYKGGPSDPVANDVWVYNNTMYSSATGTDSTRGVFVAATSTNIIVKNNLCYFPNAIGIVACLTNSGPSTTASNNTGDSGSVTQSPSFASASPVNPVDFRIATTSYAQNAGTALYPSSVNDFFNCDDNTANERMGAFVPAARAQCRGVSQ